MRIRLLIAAGSAALALLLLTAGGAAAARTCTADDLHGSRTPADLGDVNIESASKDPFIAGTRYRIVVVREYAIGDNAEPIDSTISVTAPNGPALQPATENDRPAYDFTPAAGTTRIVVSWDDQIGRSGDTCSASQAFDLNVLEPTLPTTLGSFRRGRGSNGSTFRFRLFGTFPQDPAPITVILRARKGTTRPPVPRGPAIGRFTYKPTGDGKFMTSSHDRALRGAFGTDTGSDGFFIYGEPNIPFGRTLRFAFSVEVVQNGKRVGGMRSGATCRRKQFTGHSAIKCRAVGLKQKP